MTETFAAREIVYFDDSRLIVMGGPIRTWAHPTIVQYAVSPADLNDAPHLWGRQGFTFLHWASDLISEPEYLADQEADEREAEEEAWYLASIAPPQSLVNDVDRG